MMNSQQSLLVDGPRGWKIHGRYWPVAGARGTLLGVHGYSEHSGRYSHLAHYLNGQGLDVYWIDLPGHGLSEGARNNIDHFEDYIASLEHVFREAERLGAKPPFHLFGHSLGGLVSIRFMETSPLARQIRTLNLSGPLLGLYRFDPIRMSFLRFISDILPNFRLKNKKELSGPYLTRDQEILADRAVDPLINTHVTFHWFREFGLARDRAFAELERIHVPVFIQLAGDERVVSSEAIQNFFDRLKSTQKKMIEYPDMRHEVFNEIGRERVFRDLIDWINSHQSSS